MNNIPYSSDGGRLSVAYNRSIGQVNLVINRARQTDQGMYSCTINNLPPRKHYVKVIILERRRGFVYRRPDGTLKLIEVAG